MRVRVFNFNLYIEVEAKGCGMAKVKAGECFDGMCLEVCGDT